MRKYRQGVQARLVVQQREKSTSFTSVKLSHLLDMDKITVKLITEKQNWGGSGVRTVAGRMREEWSCLDTKHAED